MDLNWLDFILIALLGLSAIHSFRRGFSREIIGLAAAIASIVLGMWFYASAGALLHRWISSERGANFAGFLLVVIAVLLMGTLIGSIVKSFLSAVGLSFFDRMLGAVFGLLRGALVAIAFLTAYIAFGPRSEAKTAPSGVVHSQIAPLLLGVSSLFVDAAPMDLKRNFREVYDQAQIEIKSIARPGKSAADEDSGRNERKF